MLKLQNITKVYTFGAGSQTALDGVSVAFRKNEFVSVLGPSGCGKTTLLNIIGGLDRYTSGDLVIKGKHTADYKDGDWDVYRNRSIGFVFQSYNLIPHQSILSNVELAMTLSGIKRSERRERAREALEKVGLGEYVHKRPNQLSGGQMQRVAIARALVNNPEILLADEPTGALDTETSTQIMEILKEVARDRLVIMVTHNPELAEAYSTRIISLLDGKIVGDTDPYEGSETAIEEKTKVKKKPMSFVTAFSLSLNNLMTKKTRTFLTSFAGSIGIIGIALILSLSNGITIYIDKVQEDTLSTYPLTIESDTMDMTKMLTREDGEKVEHGTDAVYSNSNMTEMANSFMNSMKKNDLGSLRDYFESDEVNIGQYVSDIKYLYDMDFTLYNTAGDIPAKVDSMEVMELMSSAMMQGTGYEGVSYSETLQSMGSMGDMASSMMGFDMLSELLDNRELLDSQYEFIDGGHWPEEHNEMVLVVTQDNEIPDIALYALGMRDRTEIAENMDRLMKGEKLPVELLKYTYDEIKATPFSLVISPDKYTDADGDGVYTQVAKEGLLGLAQGGIEMKICGIVRPKEGAVASSISGFLGYSPKLTEHIIEMTEDSDVVKAQMADPKTDVLTGLPFAEKVTVPEVEAFLATLTDEALKAMGEQGAGLAQLKAQPDLLKMMGEDELHTAFAPMLRPGMSAGSYEANLKSFGMVDESQPDRIAIYPKDFDSKEEIVELIGKYNDAHDEEERIIYTDMVGLMMSSITVIIDVISYVLIAFVSISLVVSSIMIGIITYISVLERTKEIGILRSIGASKKDISRVFNAETLTVGLCAGLIGIIFTVILCIPINAIIHYASGINNVSAVLPWVGGVALVLISMFLTFIAGLIPAKIAAKKDPVVALRTE